MNGKNGRFVETQFCSAGHDKNTTGRTSYGRCVLCHRKRSAVNQWRYRGAALNADGSRFTRVDFDRLYQIQGGKCAICCKHSTELKNKLDVDHDHCTGKVRGLLCRLCNSFVVNLVENHGRLIDRAKDYLKIAW